MTLVSKEVMLEEMFRDIKRRAENLDETFDLTEEDMVNVAIVHAKQHGLSDEIIRRIHEKVFGIVPNAQKHP